MKSATMRISLAGLCLLMALVAIPASTQPPPLPHAFYGVVEVNGEPASIGTQVEVSGQGVLNGITGNPLTVVQVGQYGGPGGLDPKLLAQGAIEQGAPISFHVDGTQAQCREPGGVWLDSYPFSAGSVTELDLRVVGPASTATPTDIPTKETPTPTVGPGRIAAASAICGQQSVGLAESPVVFFSGRVITQTVTFSISPDPGFAVSWDAQGTRATLTPVEFQPLLTYQLAVLGGEGLAGEQVTPMQCTFTIREASIYLPAILSRVVHGSFTLELVLERCRR